jgi:putative membrane protein
MGAVAHYDIVHSWGFEMELGGFATIGMLLSFLLVFRVNISYARYWESRGHIGSAVKCCRDLASQTCTFVEGDDSDSVSRRANIARLIRLSFSALAHEIHSKGANKWEPWARENSQKGELLSGEAKKVLVFKRPTLLLIQWLRSALMDCNASGILQSQLLAQMDQNISNLIVAFNGCTKIVSTPIPFAFSQMSKMFILLFTTLIGFGLAKVLGKVTPAMTSIIGFAFFGLDALASQMSNPFGDDQNDLPLSNFVQQVAEDTDMAVQARDGDAQPESEPVKQTARRKPRFTQESDEMDSTPAKRAASTPSWDRRASSPSSAGEVKSRQWLDRQSRQMPPLRDPNAYQATSVDRTFSQAASMDRRSLMPRHGSPGPGGLSPL